jgi:hypothetical protein
VNFDTSTYLTRGVPEITGLGSFRDKLIVCYDENIIPMNIATNSSGPPTVAVDDVVESYGTVSHKCIVPMGDDIMFMDKAGICSVQRALITATLSPTRESLLVSRDLQAVLSKLTAAQLSSNLFALYDRIASQVLFFVPHSTMAPAYESISPTKLNPLDKSTQVILSTNDRMATLTTFGTTSYVRAVNAESTGKRFFTVQGASASMASVVVGLCQAGATAAQIFAGTDSAVMLSGNGNIVVDAVYSGSTLGGTSIIAKVVQVAVDLDAKLVWFRKTNVDGTSPTNWNNNASANPATGAGGISIAALTGPLYPCGAYGTGAVTTALYFSFGTDAYSTAAPTGFLNFGTAYVHAAAYTVDPNASDVYVLCIDKSQKFRAMARFEDMAYRCGARSADGRVFFGKGQRLWYYRNQYEPQYIDDGVRGTQPWSDDTNFSDGTGWYEATAGDTWSGNAINFALSTPWSDFKEPDKVKEGKYLHCVMEGAGNVTIEQYNDRFEQPQLSMAFTMSTLPAGPDVMTRPLNNDHLYAWNSKFTRARLRVYGATKQSLALLSLGLLYLPGGYRR